ncbi:MAG: hypothetical protein ARM1_0652 [Candidatus Micrarchaeota archaeon]|nr:MAG: hypothetical protein ARM1_0652 [Candidatus Micrarchaeota archaeon]
MNRNLEPINIAEERDISSQNPCVRNISIILHLDRSYFEAYRYINHTDGHKTREQNEDLKEKISLLYNSIRDPKVVITSLEEAILDSIGEATGYSGNYERCYKIYDSVRLEISDKQLNPVSYLRDRSSIYIYLDPGTILQDIISDPKSSSTVFFKYSFYSILKKAVYNNITDRIKAIFIFDTLNAKADKSRKELKLEGYIKKAEVSYNIFKIILNGVMGNIDSPGEAFLNRYTADLHAINERLNSRRYKKQFKKAINHIRLKLLEKDLDIRDEALDKDVINDALIAVSTAFVLSNLMDRYTLSSEELRKEVVVRTYDEVHKNMLNKLTDLRYISDFVIMRTSYKSIIRVIKLLSSKDRHIKPNTFKNKLMKIFKIFIKIFRLR